MKKILIWLMLIMPAAQVATASSITVVLAGQSNAMGMPGSSTNCLYGRMLSGYSNVWISVRNTFNATNDLTWGYTTNLQYITGEEWSRYWSVELPVGDALSDVYDEVYIYKSAVGGSTVTQWQEGQVWWPLLTGAYANATAVWTDAPVPNVLIWMEGESMAGSSTSKETYMGYMLDFIADCTNFYGNPHLKVIHVGLPSWYYNKPNGPVIEQAKIELAAANENYYYVPMMDVYMAPSNGHYRGIEIIDVVGPRIANLILQDIATHDADGDGLTDLEEVNTHGTNPTSTDTDGDGMSDSNELIAGTLPTNAADVLAVECTVLPDGRRSLSWHGVQGRYYTLLYSDNIASNIWGVLSTEIPGADESISVGDSETVRTRFYRIKVRKSD